MWNYVHTDELYHHGVKGQKWGRRRYQNEDGSLTPAGKQRYSGPDGDVNRKKDAMKKASREFDRSYRTADKYKIAAISPFKKHRDANRARWDDVEKKSEAYDNAREEYKSAKNQRKVEKKYEKAGAAAGKAKYYKDKGDEASKSARQNAESLEKAAKKYDKEGKAIRAMASRKAAEHFRKSESKARASFDKKAEEYMEASKYYEKKASKIATKKNVDLGKKRINSIMKKSNDEGYRNQELYEKNVEQIRKNKAALDRISNVLNTSDDF